MFHVATATTGKNRNQCCGIHFFLYVLYIVSVDLNLLLKCHKLQSTVLHRYNRALARTCDTIAREYASEGMMIR